MEKKKSNRTNLEKKRTVFFQTGLIVALMLTIVAFEWKSPIGDIAGFDTTIGTQEPWDLPPITYTKPKPPEPIKRQDELVIKKDNEEIKNEIEVKTEADPETRVPIDSLIFIEPIDEPTEPIDQYLCEIMPQFPGGEPELLKFISDNYKLPVQTLENRQSGKIYVMFIIDEKGNVTNSSIRSSFDPFADKEALRVVNKMPKWKPGIQSGKAVKVKYILPIKIKI